MSFCSSFVALIAAMSVVTLPNAAVFCQDQLSGCPAEENLQWSYGGQSNGPSKWGETFKVCNENEQSPIDINSTKAYNDGSLPKLEFSNYDKPVDNATLENRGYTIRVIVTDDVKRTFTLYKSTYTLKHIDFHWGNVADQGTEHSIDGKKYALEVQLVHRNSHDIYGMVSVLFEEGSNSNSELKVLTNYFKDIKYKGDKTTLQTSIDLSAIIPENPASIFLYKGSLTYPPCSQEVVWYVLKKVMSTNKKQMDHFRKKLYLVEESNKDERCKLVNNIRPVQPLSDDQTVFASD